jgi:AcrR family transcriptional regulator
MEKAQDIRTVRTCKALWLAMFSLLHECSYEEITVLKLCDEAGIKRATFYLHFKDINQFTETCLINMFHESFPIISEDDPHSKRDEYLVGLFKKIVDFLDDSRDVVSLILSKTNTTLLYKLFDEALCNEMTNKAIESSKRGNIFKVPAEIIGEYYAGAFVGLIKWWLLSGKDVTKEELVGYFIMLIKKEYVVHHFK